MQSRSLAAQNHRGTPGPIPFIISERRIRGRADNPHVTFFQTLDQTRQVGDARDGHVFDSAGGRFGDCFSQAHGAALTHEDTVYAGALGGPQDRAQVARVFDSIKHDYQRLAGAANAGMNPVLILRPAQEEPYWEEAHGWQPRITSLEQVLELV